VAVLIICEKKERKVKGAEGKRKIGPKRKIRQNRKEAGEISYEI